MTPAQREKRRAFKEAMRARIRLIAQARNLPDAEVKKVMGRLKLSDLLCFAKQHGVAVDWLIAAI